MAQVRKLNLGCGYRYRNDPHWENADFPGSPPLVKRVDMRKPLPYGDERFDLVYMSHVLDHFPLHRIRELLVEVRAILRPGGVLRLSVPDLERNAAQYLASAAANRHDADRHQWHTIELIDQTTRSEFGGEKGAFLRRARSRPDIQEWLRPLLGHEMLLHLGATDAKPTLAGRLKNLIKKVIRPPARFEDSGERHFWIFDEIGLRQMLATAGFGQIERVSWDRSTHSEFLRDNLDAEGGREYKPGSLYMEAVK